MCKGIICLTLLALVASSTIDENDQALGLGGLSGELSGDTDSIFGGVILEMEEEQGFGFGNKEEILIDLT